GEDILQDLACRVAGQRFLANLPLRGNLEGCEMLATKFLDGFYMRVSTRDGHDKGFYFLAPLGMINADNGRFLDGGVSLQAVLDFHRVNIFRVAQNQVAGAGVDEEESVFVQVTHIAGFQPAIFGNGFCRSFGVVPVFFDDTGTAYADFTGRVGWQFVALFIVDFHLQSRERAACRIRIQGEEFIPVD